MQRLSAYFAMTLGIVMAIVCLVCAGLALLLWFGLADDSAIGFTVAAVVTFIVALSCIVSGRRQFMRLRQDYAWYMATYPGKTSRDGRPLCYACNSPRVAVRNVMNHTYMRAHVCSVCGTTLYFSKE